MRKIFILTFIHGIIGIAVALSAYLTWNIRLLLNYANMGLVCIDGNTLGAVSKQRCGDRRDKIAGVIWGGDNRFVRADSDPRNSTLATLCDSKNKTIHFNQATDDRKLIELPINFQGNAFLRWSITGFI
jgi:hypothetical protein